LRHGYIMCIIYTVVRVPWSHAATFFDGRSTKAKMFLFQV